MKRRALINLVIVLGLLVSSIVALLTEQPAARAAPADGSAVDRAAVSDVGAMLPLPDLRGWVDGAEEGEAGAPGPANAEAVAQPAQPLGYDPLMDNKRLLSKETLLMGYNQDVGADTHLHLRNYSLELGSLDEVQSTNLEHSGALLSHSVAAGDLTGDGVDEQIAAWVDADGDIHMALGAMPDLDGKTTSAPAAVAHADGRLDLLVRGYDNALWHRHYDGTDWGAWNNDGGGFLLSAPAIASRADGTFDVFVIMDDNQLYRRHWNGSAWDADWQLIDGGGIWPDEDWAAPVPEWPGPAAVARGGDKLDLFRLAPDNTLRWRHSDDDGATWGKWQNLGSMLASGPAAVTLGANHMQVCAAGADGAVWSLTYSGGAWQKAGGVYDWQQIPTAGNGIPDGVKIASAPTLISPAPGQVTVYVRGSSGGLWQVTYNGSRWGSWSPGDPQDKSTAGHDGDALRFDGVDDYVAVPHDDSLNPNEELTIMAWVRLEDAEGAQMIVGKARNESGYVLGVSQGQLVPEIWDSAGVSYTLSAGNIVNGVWTHLALTWQTGDDMIGYINGQEVGSWPAGDNGIGLTGARLIVGAAPWDAELGNVDGRIDEVAVFRRALSATEVFTTYQSGWEGMAGQVLGLHLDESPAIQGTTIDDASGQENDGTLYTGQALASGIGAAHGDGGLDLFASKADSSLLHSSDGETWKGFDEPWLPACCMEEPIDTGLDTTVVASSSPADHMNYLDLKTGRLLGDGREQIALAYTTYETSVGERVRLQLFDVRDGFDLELIAAETISFDEPVATADAYYPKIALGEFDGTPGDEIAVAYAREGGNVTVWEDYDYQGAQLSWMQGSFNNLKIYDMNDKISSIMVKPGWQACVYWDLDFGGGHYCLTGEIPNLNQAGIGNWNDAISSIRVERDTTSTSKATLDTAPETAPGEMAQLSQHRNAHIALDIFDFDPETRKLSSRGEPFYYEVPGFGDFPAPERTLNIVSGDFDGISAYGEGTDEIAMSYDFVDYYPQDSDAEYHALFRVLDIGIQDETITIAEDPDLSDHFSFVFNDGKNTHLTVQLHLAAGDLDGDGVDEIVRTWPRWIDFDNWPMLGRNLEVIDLDRGSEPIKEELDNTTFYSDLDALAVGDLDMELREEIIFHNEAADPGIVGGLYVYRYDPLGSDPIWEMLTQYYPINHEFYKRPVLVTGDFTGQSLRLGRPTYRVQNQVYATTALLNMPPKHRDLVWDDAAGDYEYIAIRAEFCETRPDHPWCSHAKHGKLWQDSQETTTQSKRDWGVGAGLDVEKGIMGYTFKAAFEYNHGEKFDESAVGIKSESFNQSAVADIQDVIVYSGAPLGVWEYPLLAGETGEVFDYVTIVYPLVRDTGTPKPTPVALDRCEEYWSDFSHQLYNVWSYDPFGDDVKFPDYDPATVVYRPTSPYGGVEAEFEAKYSDFTATITNSHISNRFDTRLEFGHGSEVGQWWMYHSSFKIHAKGHYGWDEIATQKTTATESTAVSVYFESVPTDRGFDTYPILFWGRTGALTLDYQTEPGLGRVWQMYGKPDPAFILPWYGFPYPFPEPDPTGCARDSERCLYQRPPCGDDKQLFSQDVEVSPRIASVGDRVTISATVRNFSKEAADNVVVRFYQGDPTEGVVIGERTIAGSLLRSGAPGVEYPKTVAINWVASGAGEQKIYAVIDPDDVIDEVHDDGDLIDNNVAYGLVQIGAAEHVDMGLADEVAYQALSYEQGGTSGRVALQEASGGAAAYQANSPVVSAYVPPGNMTEIVRFDLRDAPFNLPGVVGRAFELVAYPGSSDWEEQANFELWSDGDPPAVIRVAYGEADIAGRDEGALTLYWLDLSGWRPAEETCPGYEVQRFPGDNLIAVPVCRTGLFAFSDKTPPKPNYWPGLFLPLVLRDH